MKKTLSKFASSFAALLSDSTVLDADGRMEDIRDAMLQSLAPHMGQGVDMPRVWASIARAVDIQALWYLRSDVMQFLADQSGEPSAQQTLSKITEMFRGVVPDAQMPRVRRVGK